MPWLGRSDCHTAAQLVTANIESGIDWSALLQCTKTSGPGLQHGRSRTTVKVQRQVATHWDSITRINRKRDSFVLSLLLTNQSTVTEASPLFGAGGLIRVLVVPRVESSNDTCTFCRKFNLSVIFFLGASFKCYNFIYISTLGETDKNEGKECEKRKKK